MKTIEICKRFTRSLTAGIDGVNGGTNFTGGAGNDVFNAIADGSTAAWSPLDVINGGGGTNTFNVSGSPAITVPAGALVTNIQTANFISTSTVVADVTGFTGLTALNVTGSGTETLTAAATTNVTATDSVQGAGVITITGGKDVTLVAAATEPSTSAVDLGNVIIGGASTAAPVGAVSATVTDTQTVAGSRLGDITVTGGVGVTVNSTVNAKVPVAPYDGTATDKAGLITVAPTSGAVVINSATNVTVATAITGTNTVTGSAISVTGGSTVSVAETASILSTATAVSAVAQGDVAVKGDATTTAVTVTQTAAATGAAAKTLVVGAAGTVAVTEALASPGVTGLTGVDAVSKATAQAVAAATKTVTDGGVTIADAKATNSTTVTGAADAGTITAVTLANYGTSTISSAALNTLTLSGTGTSVTTLEGGSTAATNTTLALNLGGGTQALVADSSAQFKTINAVLTAATAITTLTDTALKTLAISGTGVLTAGTIPTSLTSLTVAGAAGFSGTLVGTGVTSFTGANTTAANTVTFSPATVTYTGGTGVDTVTVTANATKAVTGGGGADVLVMDTSVTPSAAGMRAFVSGFPTLQTASTSGSIDMSMMPADITALKSTATSGGVTFTNVADSTSLALTGAHSGGTTNYALANTGGALKSVTVTLGTSTTNATSAMTTDFGTISLLDFNSNGIGTVSLVSNGVNISTGSATANYNTLATLTDTAVSQLNVSGTNGLIVGSTSYTNTQTVVTINNTNSSTYGLSMPLLIDTSLDTLTFTGSGMTRIAILDDGTVGHLTLANTGTGTAFVGQIHQDSTTDTSYLTNLTLNGNVALGTKGAPVTDTHTGAAVTVDGSTDNAGVALDFTGANSFATTVTLGNGNNYVHATATTGGGNITTGSGMDWVQQGALTGSATASSTVSTGAGMDTIVTGVGYSGTVVTHAVGGAGADYIQVQSQALVGDYSAFGTYDSATGTAGKYGSVVWAGDVTTGTLVTSGTWTGTLYAESADTITSSGVIQPTFKTLMTPTLVNAAGAGLIFADANIIAPMTGEGAILVASTAKDVFLFQTNNGNTNSGKAAGGSIVEDFKIGTDVIAVTNYQGSNDNLFVGNAAAVTAINAVTASEALLASTHGWAWAFDAGSTTAGVLTYTGSATDLTTTNGGVSPTYASMTIHLVGVQGTIAGADSFFYHA